MRAVSILTYPRQVLLRVPVTGIGVSMVIADARADTDL
jgi:hypothetical protein